MVSSNRVTLRERAQWLYVKPFTLNNVDLGDLAALQAQIPLTTGYYLLDVGAKINPPLEYIFLQTFEERNRIIEMQEKTYKDCFAAPDTSILYDYSHIYLDLLCEDTF